MSRGNYLFSLRAQDARSSGFEPSMPWAAPSTSARAAGARRRRGATWAVRPINAGIRFSREIEELAFRLAGAAPPTERAPAPCCLDALFDRHFLAHVAAHCC